MNKCLHFMLHENKHSRHLCARYLHINMYTYDIYIYMCVWEILMDRFLSQLNDRIFKTQGKAPQTAAKRNCEPEDKTMLHRRIVKSLESQKTGLKLFFFYMSSFIHKERPSSSSLQPSWSDPRHGWLSRYSLQLSVQYTRLAGGTWCISFRLSLRHLSGTYWEAKLVKRCQTCQTKKHLSNLNLSLRQISSHYRCCWQCSKNQKAHVNPTFEHVWCSNILEMALFAISPWLENQRIILHTPSIRFNFC